MFELAIAFFDIKMKEECSKQIKANFGDVKKIIVTDHCIFVSQLSMETALLLANTYAKPYQNGIRRVNINGEFRV